MKRAFVSVGLAVLMIASAVTVVAGGALGAPAATVKVRCHAAPNIVATVTWFWDTTQGGSLTCTGMERVFAVPNRLTGATQFTVKVTSTAAPIPGEVYTVTELIDPVGAFRYGDRFPFQGHSTVQIHVKA